MNFERNKDPKETMGLGLIANFGKFAKNAGMVRTEPDREDLKEFENDEILAKWQQFAKGRFWSGYLILYKEKEDGELYTFINSDYDEATYHLEHWMAQPVWIYHFAGDF